MTDIEAMKRNIEQQLKEYEDAIEAAVTWHREWKARQPKGFRIKEGAAYRQTQG
jgi:hypothetical protein